MFGALFMMYYRELSARMPSHWCLYYAFEAKTFGEQAGGVGEQTDIYIARHGEPLVKVGEELMKRLNRLWGKYRPRWPRDEALASLCQFPELKHGATATRVVEIEGAHRIEVEQR